jgi:ELWxxDGT repeat protein
VTDRGLRDLTVVGDQLFFVRDHADDGVGSAELWVSTGTESGTTLVKQIQRDDNLDDSTAEVGELLYFFQAFQADISSDAIRYELWKSDGTSNGTVLVKVIGTSGFEPETLRATSNRLFFRDGNGSRKVWTSDGTSDGTVEVASSALATLNYTAAFGETLFFGGSDKALWKTTDGSLSGTQRVETPPAAGDGVRELEVVGDWLYYAFDSRRKGSGLRELWRTVGTSGTAERLTDFNSSVSKLTRVGDLLYFVEGSTKLWSTNGALQELIIDSQVREIGNFQELTPAGDSLFFTGEETITSEYNAELWFSGGSSETSSRLYSETTVGNDILDYGLAAVGDKIFFTTGEGDSLFSSDGATTTEVVVDNQDDNTYELTSAAGILYFVSFDSAWERPRLWSFNLNAQTTSGGGSYYSPVSSPVLPLATLQTKVLRFEDFTSNSSVLSKRARAGIPKAVKKFTTVNTVVCTGYTSGVRATASQRKLALDRARVACNVAKKLAPDVVVKIQAAAAMGTGPKFRAVRVKITGN